MINTINKINERIEEIKRIPVSEGREALKNFLVEVKQGALKENHIKDIANIIKGFDNEDIQYQYLDQLLQKANDDNHRNVAQVLKGIKDDYECIFWVLELLQKKRQNKLTQDNIGNILTDNLHNYKKPLTLSEFLEKHPKGDQDIGEFKADIITNIIKLKSRMGKLATQNPSYVSADQLSSLINIFNDKIKLWEIIYEVTTNIQNKGLLTIDILNSIALHEGIKDDEKWQLLQIVVEPEKFIVNAFNATTPPQEKEDSAAFKERQDAFVNYLKQAMQLTTIALPEAFEKKAKDAFVDLNRIYKNKGSKELSSDDISKRNWGNAIKDCLIMIVEIILLFGIFRAFGADCLVPDSSSKQSAHNHKKDFAKMIKDQQAQRANAGQSTGNSHI